MYERPVISEIDLATTTSCCAPTPSPEEQCRANGGIYSNVTKPFGLACIEPTGDIAGAWIAFARCAAQGAGHDSCGSPYLDFIY